MSTKASYQLDRSPCTGSLICLCPGRGSKSTVPSKVGEYFSGAARKLSVQAAVQPPAHRVTLDARAPTNVRRVAAGIVVVEWNIGGRRSDVGQTGAGWARVCAATADSEVHAKQR